MSPQRFDHLLSLVGPRIKKDNTNPRKAIPIAERLAITPRFFTSDESHNR